MVIDNGSGTIKAGKAGEEQPQFIIPTIVGRSKSPGLEKELYIGHEAA